MVWLWEDCGGLYNSRLAVAIGGQTLERRETVSRENQDRAAVVGADEARGSTSN